MRDEYNAPPLELNAHKSGWVKTERLPALTAVRQAASRLYQLLLPARLVPKCGMNEFHH
jgi:hypothetical protein